MINQQTGGYEAEMREENRAVTQVQQHSTGHGDVLTEEDLIMPNDQQKLIVLLASKNMKIATLEQYRNNLRAELLKLKSAFENMCMRKISDGIQKVLDEN